MPFAKPAPESGWLTARQVALQIGGTKQHHIYSLVHRGDLSAYRFGGTWRFKQADIDEYVAECRLDAKPRSARKRRKT